MKGIGFPRRKGPTESVRSIRRTDQPGPRFNYELFNCNNFNIRYWSWNYRGCWPFFLDNRQTVINMARPSNPGSFRTEVDTFPRSTRMRQRLILRNSLSLRSGLEWCIHTRLPPNKAVSQALSPPEKGAHSHSRCGVQRRSSTLSGVSSTVKNLLEVPPDLPSNCSSLRDLNCTHSNYKTQRALYCYLLSLPPRVGIG